MSMLTITAVLGLAVVDMLSPALIGVTLYLLLARPRRTGLLLGVYLATVASAYFLLGVVLMAGLGVVAPYIDDHTWTWVQGGVGAALFIGSFLIPAKRPDRRPVRPRSPSVQAMVLLGFGTWLFEFATALPYFGAIAVMTTASLTPAQWLPLLAAYVLIMVVPGILLYLAWLLLRTRMETRFGRWRRKLAENSRSTAGWVMGIVGVILVLNALPSEIVLGGGG